MASCPMPPRREGRRWQKGTCRTCQLPAWGSLQRGWDNHGYLQTETEATFWGPQ